MVTPGARSTGGGMASDSALAVAPEVTEAAEELVADEALVEELLVEEISIDGMCGVY
jgi:mycofactocin precursor